jgi:hypothetical protein
MADLCEFESQGRCMLGHVPDLLAAADAEGSGRIFFLALGLAVSHKV